MAHSEEITTRHSTVEEWTRALAESVGSPGGGAGAGVMLAIAASLTSMVAGYTETDGDQQDHLQELLTRAQDLRKSALQLADDDASASRAFGAAFRLEAGSERDAAIREASLGAARSSATLGDQAIDAIEDLRWLAENGNRALIADVVVAFGALRAAVTGARTNVSFDLATLRSAGLTLEEIREQQPALWATVERLDAGIERIDAEVAAVDHRAAPTDAL
ncbi:MAG: cyclodeaminase/cyclohydrolase family protein [Actinomycetes bacterium]